MWVGRKSLIRRIDVKRIEDALREAEKRSSGEIRVSVAPMFWGSVRKAAERAFARLGMTRTKARNGVLLFVVPSRRRFVVLGDAGIHAKVGQEFWDKVAAALSAKFRAGDFTGGLVDAIAVVGEQLARHFPQAGEADVNELPDRVDFGP
jgi:uncharacterized membrane protein